MCLQPAVTPPTVNQYSLQYEEDVSTLGRGALSFVSLARRRQDSFEAVAKKLVMAKHGISLIKFVENKRVRLSVVQVLVKKISK